MTTTIFDGCDRQKCHIPALFTPSNTVYVPCKNFIKGLIYGQQAPLICDNTTTILSSYNTGRHIIYTIILLMDTVTHRTAPLWVLHAYGPSSIR